MHERDWLTALSDDGADVDAANFFVKKTK